MPKRPPMEIEFVASPRADAEEKHKALLALLARGVADGVKGSHAPMELEVHVGAPRRPS